MGKIKIVNLSSIHGEPTIMQGLYAFAELCDSYSSSFLATYCFHFFTHFTNLSWVAWKYKSNQKTVIDPYKLGLRTTEQFLNELLDIFYFLKDPNLKLEEEDKARLLSNKEAFISLKNKQQPTQRDLVLALLEEAWNSISTYGESDKVKFEYLTKNDDIIYLISNSNEVNVYNILYKMKMLFPNIPFYKDIDTSVKINQVISGQFNSSSNAAYDNRLIEIAPHIYLCLSYRFQSYKTHEDNQRINVSTASLLNILVDEILTCNKTEIEVISQYPKDLVQARELNIPEYNIHLAAKYYPTPGKELRYQQ